MSNRLLKLIPNPENESLTPMSSRVSTYDKERAAALAEAANTDPSVILRTGIHIQDYIAGTVPPENSAEVSKLLTELLYRVNVNNVLKENLPVLQQPNSVLRKVKKQVAR